MKSNLTNSEEYEQFLQRLSYKELKELLFSHRNDLLGGIYVESKKAELVDRIKAITAHLKKRDIAIATLNQRSPLGNYSVIQYNPKPVKPSIINRLFNAIFKGDRL